MGLGIGRLVRTFCSLDLAMVFGKRCVLGGHEIMCLLDFCNGVIWLRDLNASRVYRRSMLEVSLKRQNKY